jgi:hypothetical protein
VTGVEQGASAARERVVPHRRAFDDPRSVRRWTANPFHVLELPTTATWTEIERRTSELLAREVTDEIDTPVGPRSRSAAEISAALEALRDPDARLLYEVWASVPTRREETSVDDEPLEWRDAMAAFGWRQR